MFSLEETSARAERYLARLDRALAGIDPRQREDIVREIRCHIAERVEGAGQAEGQALDDTLWGLGSPEVLATTYRKEAMLEQASRSQSPWLLARTALRWMRTGAAGFGIFMTALIGYSLSATLFVTGAIKPLFPENIGLWLDPPNLDLGWRSLDLPPARELLGPWLPLVTFVLGLLALMATNAVMRRLIRHIASQRRARTAWRMPANGLSRSAI